MLPDALLPVNPTHEAREKAVILEQVGRYREAAHLWHLVLADAPDDADVLCHLAHNYSLVGERWRAGEYVAQALAADPNNEWAHRIHCSLALCRGRKTAVAFAQKSVELNPTGSRGWYALANAYLLAGEVEKARAAALRLRELVPDWSESHETVGRVALRLGKLPAAEKEARRALSIDAENFTAYLLLADILWAMKNHQEAAASFLQALKLQPESHRVRWRLVLCILAARYRFCLNRVPLSPEVEAAFRAERAQIIKAVFRRARRLWEAVE